MARRIEKILDINASVEQCFQRWMRDKVFPKLLRGMKPIQKGENNRWHWVASTRLWGPLEWDTVIDVYEPNKVISWHSLPDSVMATSGSINFQGESNNRTRLYVSLSYEPPMAGIGEFFSDVIENPDYMVEKDLINFKKRIEQEFGRTSPQPAIVGYREDKTALNDELKFTL